MGIALFLTGALTFALTLGVKDLRKVRTSNYKDEFITILKDLLEHEALSQLKEYTHHIGFTRFDHSLNVAYYNFRLSKALGLKVREATRAGLLHDFFLYDWRVRQAETGEKNHLQLHPKKALETAQLYFDISDREADIIINHMWPLTFDLPKYPETFLITFVDKYCAIMEFTSTTGEIITKATSQAITRLASLFSTLFQLA